MCYHTVFSSVYTMSFDFYFPNCIYLNLGFAKLQDVLQYQPFLEVRQWKKRLSCVRAI